MEAASENLKTSTSATGEMKVRPLYYPANLRPRTPTSPSCLHHPTRSTHNLYITARPGLRSRPLLFPPSSPLFYIHFLFSPTSGLPNFKMASGMFQLAPHQTINKFN